ncbi:hypothetical protein [Lacrimispora sp.]|nr:hypothetical protein [Lacrimispora sp.]
MNDLDKYTVIGEFECRGIKMVIVKAAHGTHVMPKEDWKKLI